MRPSFLDSMSYAMSQVYASVTDKILVNIAKHFPFYDPDATTPGVFEYQSKMLAQMGQVRKETVDIIMQNLDGADDALRNALEAAIMDALKDETPKLRDAAQKGLLGTAEPPEIAPNQMNAFQMYYKQSADKLNLVNTVMLESTESAYRQTVSNICSVILKINHTQDILNASTGEVITGVSAWNSAMHGAVRKMVENGLTGFIDHAGRHWSPEAYVAMDIRTTMFNASREAIWENANSFGSDLYQVSSHNGARPLCYPWQGKVISRTDRVREVQDLDGNKIHVYAQSETTYGQAAGLFGINCKHYPMTFIPGLSTLRGEPQDPEENEQAYAESQEQRALERKLRKEKLDLSILKAEGADEEMIKAQRDRVRRASADIDDFCDKTGRARRRNREYTPINASFPDKDSYDPHDFNTETRDRINSWFGNTGRNAQQPSASQTEQAQSPVQQPKQEARQKTSANTLTQEQRNALEDYVSGDTMYINQVLRGKAGEATKEDKEIIKVMDSALDVELGKKQTLWRSVDASAVFGNVTAIDYENMRGALVYNDSYGKQKTEAIFKRVIDKVIPEKGYMSTTTDFEIASEWGGFSGSEMPIVLKLETTKKTRGRDLSMFDVEGEEQKEVLLARNQKYHVSRFGSQDGNIIVYAEMVDK